MDEKKDKKKKKGKILLFGVLSFFKIFFSHNSKTVCRNRLNMIL